MRIAMFTNTYLPHVGGVAKSVHTLERECRALGHEVKVVAPAFDGAEDSPDVLRVPAIQKFNGSDFSVRLPIPNLIRDYIKEFKPDVIHSHHPFLLGDAALREGWKLGVPVIFTHHTLYEEYTHYVPLDSAALKRVVIQLATEYCNLCNGVIAPSESVARLLADRGVTSQVTSVPTGIDTSHYAKGDGAAFKRQAGIPEGSLVIGHVGRLAREKNLIFLAHAVKQRLERDRHSVFLLVGAGSASDEVVEILSEQMAEGRVFAVGAKTGNDLAGAYAAMDLFVFASQSETQGMVLAEAMAAGKPVVALDGPGVREIVRDGVNGLLLDGGAGVEQFSAAIDRLADDKDFRRSCAEAATETTADYDKQPCAGRIVDCYEAAISTYRESAEQTDSPWDLMLQTIGIEWELLSMKMNAAFAAMSETSATEARLD